MTTATANPKTRAAGAVATNRLRPNTWNKARPLDPAFVESIRAQGVLSSLLIREVEEDAEGRDLEIICGERRWMAAMEADREYVPAIIAPLDDQAARLATLTENTHRVGLTPWQEAQVIGELLAQEGMDIAAASAATGWSEGMIRRRAKLLDLSPSWRAAMEAGDLDGWNAGHFEVLAIFDEKRQEALHKDLFPRIRGCSVADLKEEIADRSTSLKSAPWDLDDVTLVPKVGACTDCPKRSDAQADLFGQVPDLVKAGASCLDEGCFKKKGSAFTQRKAAAILEKHPEAVKVAVDYSVQGKGYLRSHEISPAKKGDKGAVAALQYAEGGKVSLAYVKLKKAAQPKDVSPKTKAKEVEAKRQLQIRALAIEKLAEAVKDPDTEFTDDAYPLLLQFCLIAGVEVMDGAEEKDKEKRIRAFAKKPITLEELWAPAARGMEQELQSAIVGLKNGWGNPEDDAEAIARIAWMVGADFEALLKEAAAEVDGSPASPTAEGGAGQDAEDDALWPIDEGENK